MATRTQLGEQEYLKQRVEGQLAWFEKKSAWNQKRYKRLRLAVIVLSVLIPLLVAFIKEDPMISLQVAAGLAGVCIAVAEGWLSLYKFQENWIQYRATAEALKQETFLYKTGAGEYRQAENTFLLFVERIEAIIEGDTHNWKQYISRDEGASGR